MNKVLAVIPGRKGSKGIPKKNTKKLNGKPLISYAIEAALECFNPEDICITTNDEDIIKTASKHGLKVPFTRPESLSGDHVAMISVLEHAIGFYSEVGREYDTLILLQPTSPFRKANHILEALEIYKKQNVDMVVSVKETKANPYYNLFEEDSENYLQKSKQGDFIRRQDIPKVYELNGAIYIINIKALIETGDISALKKKRKYLMDEISSFDLDTMFDWLVAENIIKTAL